jgi:hypothetical protein
MNVGSLLGPLETSRKEKKDGEAGPQLDTQQDHFKTSHRNEAHLHFTLCLEDFRGMSLFIFCQDCDSQGM